jgi:hypothetical protein
MGCLNYLLSWIASKEECRKINAGEFGFAVARRHIDNDAVFLPRKNIIVQFSDYSMMRALDEIFPKILYEREEFAAGIAELFCFLKFFEEREECRLFVRGQKRNLRFDLFEIHFPGFVKRPRRWGRGVTNDAGILQARISTFRESVGNPKEVDSLCLHRR